MGCDVVVVGGGLSGLMAAITAAKKGRKTLLLEKHVTVGGLAAGFTRKGYYFDASMGRCMGQSISGYLREIGLLQEADLRPQQAIWNIEGRWVEYTSLSSFFSGLAEVFPDEKDALLTFYERAVRPVEAQYALLFADTGGMKGLRKVVHLVRVLAAFPAIARGMSSKETERDVLTRYLDRTGLALAFLEEKEDEVDYRGDMSFVTKVGKWYTQMFNVYPHKGFQRLAGDMAAIVKAHGGEVRTSAPVSKIIVENGRAIGVEVTRHGEVEKIPAGDVICCVDLNKAFRQLIGTEHLSADLISRLERSRLASAIPILFLGLNVPPEVVRARFQGAEEVFLYPRIEPRVDESQFFSDHPLVAHSSCFHNPAHAPAGKTNLQVYLSCPRPGWMGNWGIVDGKRTGAYRQIKKMVTDSALGALEMLIPELHDRSLIEVCELGTPFTIERYTGNTDGSGLGFRMDADYVNSKRFGKYSSRCTGIAHLYLAGQQTGYPGGIGNALGAGKAAGKLV